MQLVQTYFASPLSTEQGLGRSGESESATTDRAVSSVQQVLWDILCLGTWYFVPCTPQSTQSCWIFRHLCIRGKITQSHFPCLCNVQLCISSSRNPYPYLDWTSYHVILLFFWPSCTIFYGGCNWYTLYRLMESLVTIILLEKILMWQRRKKRLSDQPIDPYLTHSHALWRMQPRRKSGWTKSRCEAPWWRKKCGRTGVSDLALLPTFLQISPSYTYTLAQTLPESHPHRCKYFTSSTEAEEELYCFVQGDVVLEPTGVGFSRAPAPSISSEQLQVGSPQVNTSTSTCGWTSCCCSTCWGSGQSSYFLWPPWLVMWRLKRNHD